MATGYESAIGIYIIIVDHLRTFDFERILEMKKIHPKCVARSILTVEPNQV